MNPTLIEIFAGGSWFQVTALLGVALFFAIVAVKELYHGFMEGYLYLMFSLFFGVAHAMVTVNALTTGMLPGLEEFGVWTWLVSLLAPALCAVLLSMMWGRSGWLLSVNSARSQAVLVLWRSLRRDLSSTAGLPTIQGVEVIEQRDGYRGLLIRRAKGTDWKLGVPATWPAELIEALAARIANLAGVEFGEGGGGGAAEDEESEVPVEEAAE